MSQHLISMRRLVVLSALALFLHGCTSEEPESNSSASNAAEQVQTLIRQRPQGESWVNVYRQQFTYDAAGHQESMQHAVWVDGNWENRYKNVYVRNRQGQEEKIVSLRWRNSGWDTTQTTSFTYDSLGRRLQVFSGPIEEGSYANKQRSEYHYADSGHVVIATTFRPLYDDTTGKNVELADQEIAWTTQRAVTKQFNEDSLLTEQTTERTNRSTVKTSFHYGDDHHLDRQVEKKQSENGWRNSRRVFFTYNDDGKIKEKRVQTWNGSEWADKTRAETTFQRGRPHQLITWQREDGTWQKTNRLLYQYR